MSDHFSLGKVYQRERLSVLHLVFCGVLLCLIYAATTWLSGSFAYQTRGVKQPGEINLIAAMDYNVSIALGNKPFPLYVVERNSDTRMVLVTTANTNPLVLDLRTSLC